MDLPPTVSRHGPAPTGWVPVDACRLPTAEQPLRLAEWDDLFAASLRAVEHRPGAAPRARLVLAGDAALRDRAQRLADAESSCCSFFTFTLAPLVAEGADRAVVALDVEVPAARADVLFALVDRGERVLRATA